MRAWPLLFLALAGGLACRSKAQADATLTREPAVSAAPALSATPPSGPEHFGAPLSEQPTTELAAVLKDPKAYAELVTVEGKVRRACTRKGCWMELASPTDDAQRCRVTFKDYGFFVPTDSAGASAKVQGQVVSKLVTAGNVEHLEGEGAVFPNKHADGSASEVRLVATGVELVR